MRCRAIGTLTIGILWWALTGPAYAADVDTNPMNNDPQVRAAFKDFYNLDYADAAWRFSGLGFAALSEGRPLRAFCDAGKRLR